MSQATSSFVPGVQPAPLAQAPTTSSPDQENVERTRVLIADGSPTVRKILRHTLRELNWDTVEAEDGPEALHLAGSRPFPHAILLDLNVGKVDGCEVCRRLKADMQFRTIPVIIMTSSDGNEEKTRAAQAGADEFLSKPINRAELSVRLRSLARMHRFNQELIGAESVALALARAVSSKDGYSSGHVEQMANCAAQFGAAIGLDPVEIKILRYGAILHNVGKIAIPDAVLEKTEPLTPRERALFHQHPRVGCDICAPLKPLKPVLPIIRHHKEHWDGTGYPDGLREDEIPLGAQIVGIVDVYSALINDRPFRKAMTHQEAVAQLRERARHGVHSPELIGKFIDWLEQSSPDGSNNTAASAEDSDAAPRG